MNLYEIGENAKRAAQNIAYAPSQKKNNVLLYLSQSLLDHTDEVLHHNALDCKQAKALELDSVLIDRMFLNEEKLKTISRDLINIAQLKDPIGEVLEEKQLDNGLKLRKIRNPIGVIGVIYESRPNVTIDIAALTIKTGNASILRGGKETLNTNKFLIKLIKEALIQSGMEENAVNFIENSERSTVLELLKMHQYIDMIIPRGGASLHEFCRENSRIPVITGGIGICHLFIDESAQQEKSINVIINAKTQNPSVCNSLDTVLIHKNIAYEIIPKMIEALSKYHVIFKIDEEVLNIIDINKYKEHHIDIAKEEDWHREWLNLTLGIKVSQDLESAIQHIKKNGSGHSDGILTENEENVIKFFQQVDSAVVYHNASTRFTDGGQFGFGAEVAISTQKLHARGPMGLNELTSYHWEVQGNYQTR